MRLRDHKLNQLELMLRQTEYVSLSQLQAGLANWEGANQPKDQLSARQVFRYVKDLERQRGIRVEQRRATEENKEPAYRIYSPSMINGPGLSDEQLEQLMFLLDEGRADGELRAKLLHILSGARAAAFYFRDKAIILEKAMKRRVKIVVGVYYGRDGEKTRLTLDPVRYDGANGRLYALKDGHRSINKVKKYNLELMEDIQLTEEPCAPIFGFDPNTVDHDPFGFMPDGETYQLRLLLRPFAYSQLFRQFPHLMVFVEKLETPIGDFRFRLQIKVYDIQPIARFVTGLLNEVLIEGDEQTRSAIERYIETRVAGGMAQNFGAPEWVKVV